MTYEAFKSVIRASGLTMDELATLMKMSRPTLQKRLEKPYNLKVSEAQRLSEILKIGQGLIVSPI
jgi:transcriptional regulator with XRE-family HTH domain